MVADRRTGGLHDKDVVAAYPMDDRPQLTVGEPLHLARQGVGTQR